MTDHIPTLEEDLKAAGEEVPDTFVCPCCRQTHPPFAVVRKGKTASDGYHCSTCHLDAQRAAMVANEKVERERIEREDPWNSEYGKLIKLERNRLLEGVRWAVDPLTSPLSEECQAQFVEYIKQLHRITLDFAHPDEVVWPKEPALEFPPEEG